MSLRYALLGLLARESMTGYDLTKRFDSTVGFFWPAKHSQIYPELAALNKEGLVTFEVVAQTSKPNKKVYTITDAGRDAVASWVSDDLDKRTVKDPLLMRIWTIGVAPAGPQLTSLRNCMAELKKRVSFLVAVEKEVSTHEGPLTADNPNLGMILALRCGIRQNEAYRDWLRETLVILEALEPELKKVEAAR